MSITVFEKAFSLAGNDTLNGDNSTRSKTWVVLGTDDVQTAGEAVLTASEPSITTINGQTLVRASLDPQQIGPDAWEFQVNYVMPGKASDDGDGDPIVFHISFDTTGGTHKLTQSKLTTGRFSWSEGQDPAPNLQGAIGWDGKKLTGVDIFVGKLEFTVETYYQPGYVTTAIMRMFASVTGRTNSDYFLTFVPGELLYLGAQGETTKTLLDNVTPTTPAKVIHKFAYSEDKGAFTIGDINIPGKKGWEYLWVVYKKIEEGGKLYPVPRHAYVEQVYDSFSCSLILGFGATPPDP